MVPFEQLSAEVLQAIAEDFCTRDGTDYAERELPLEEKVALLLNQLRAAQVHIVFEAESETLRIVTTDELPNKPA